MRKFIIACAAALLAGFACAGDFEVSSVRDTAAERTGVRIGTTVAGLNVNATNISDLYTRFAVGKDFELVKAGPVAFSAGAAGVYQNSMAVGKDDGFGMTVGVKAATALTKSVSAVVGVERFIGTDRVKDFNGNVVTAGLKINL